MNHIDNFKEVMPELLEKWNSIYGMNFDYLLEN